MALGFGGIGFGRDRYGNLRDAGTAVPSTPSEMRGPLPLLTRRVVGGLSTMSSFSHRPPQLWWTAPRNSACSISA